MADDMTLRPLDELAALVAATLAAASPDASPDTIARRAYGIAESLDRQRQLRDDAFGPELPVELDDLVGDPEHELEPRWSAEDRQRLAQRVAAVQGPGLASGRPPESQPAKTGSG